MRQTVSMGDISVLMPIRNGMKFAGRSLRQISEMANGAEVLIIDDGSVDGSYEYCQSFSKNQLNFVVTRNPGVGICDALNYGISISTRKWIARFDVDDEYLPSRLFEQLKIINSTNASLVFSDYCFFSDKPISLGSIPGGVLNLPTKLSLVTGRRTPHPSAVFLKDACLEAGGYLSEDSPSEDLSLWLRMCENIDLASTEIELLKYRLSASSTTLANREMSIKKRKAILRKYPIKVDYFEYIVINLNEVLTQYSNMRSSGKRTALLIFDIVHYARFYKVDLPFSKYLMLCRKLFKFNVLLAVFQLFLEARRRKIFRRNIIDNR